jgi:hypothetical protein
MDLFPIREVSGFGEILWSFRQWRMRGSARQWLRVPGVVEGHELLASGSIGWVVVLYSYGFQGESFSGEWRTWVLVQRPFYDQAAAIVARMPKGMKIGVRIDPGDSSKSVAEL